ncbi:Arc family DNA-binding protein [Leucobacter insecticola]|uniref:Arc family DNA-binding protein n=1 Tax=Leucobacter insecticola TaxID=2714934 RepID=A0A6G8FHA2_9MICO|nr:Arc family DNA-binding protein [Leucobacter insecticola]QIM15412.1 Arc family DNA-binding protein [Leucobacter insecticola]
MAQLLIRQLPDEVKEGLRELAREKGRSMEAEARAILVDRIRAENRVTVEYEGTSSVQKLHEIHGVKLLNKGPGARTVTFEETQALIDEFV